jgi:hypothetical protein
MLICPSADRCPFGGVMFEAKIPELFFQSGVRFTRRHIDYDIYILCGSDRGRSFIRDQNFQYCSAEKSEIIG